MDKRGRQLLSGPADKGLGVPQRLLRRLNVERWRVPVHAHLADVRPLALFDSEPGEEFGGRQILCRKIERCRVGVVLMSEIMMSHIIDGTMPQLRTRCRSVRHDALQQPGVDLAGQAHVLPQAGLAGESVLLFSL